MNRRERRKQAALDRKGGGNTQASSFEEILTSRVQTAIVQSVHHTDEPQETAVPKIVQALGTTSAVFAIQAQASRRDFLDAAGSWYDMVSSQLQKTGSDAEALHAGQRLAEPSRFTEK